MPTSPVLQGLRDQRRHQPVWVIQLALVRDDLVVQAVDVLGGEHAQLTVGGQYRREHVPEAALPLPRAKAQDEPPAHLVVRERVLPEQGKRQRALDVTLQGALLPRDRSWVPQVREAVQQPLGRAVQPTGGAEVGDARRSRHPGPAQHHHVARPAQGVHRPGQRLLVGRHGPARRGPESGGGGERRWIGARRFKRRTSAGTA
mmetsp:Transcript_19004/g.53873  ORF Transcript_19004/g.53873 Transcript_19004/m.53873 type:complete len:202 (+) Transcript_19004:793-1398(+)